MTHEARRPTRTGSELRLPPSLCTWTLDHPVLVISFFTLVTVACAAKLGTTPLTADPLRVFVEQTAELQAHTDRNQAFGGDAGKTIIVATNEGDQLFTARLFASLSRATVQIEDISGVQSVDSLDTAIRGAGGGRQSSRSVAKRTVARRRLLAGEIPADTGRPDRYWPKERNARRRVEFRRLKQEMLADPEIAGLLVSLNGQYQAIVVALHPAEILGIDEQQDITRQIETILREQGLGERGLYTVGLPISNLAMVAAMKHSFVTLLPISALLLGILLLLAFHRFAVVLVALTIGGCAIVWGLGVTAFVFGELTMLVAGAPLVILAVSTTDFIHLTSAYEQSLREGLSRRAAIIHIFSHVGGACLLTSVTTLVGFGALIVVSAPTVRHF